MAILDFFLGREKFESGCSHCGGHGKKKKRGKRNKPQIGGRLASDISSILSRGRVPERSTEELVALFHSLKEK